MSKMLLKLTPNLQSNRLSQTSWRTISANLSNNRRYASTNEASKQIQIHPPAPPHTPVMIREVIKSFQPEPNQLYVDMTFGAGGHSRKLLETEPTLKIIALDRDPHAHEYAKQMSDEFPGQVVPLLGRFSELPGLLKSNGVKESTVDGILFDFGCSSMQFDQGERGFSISKDGPLDMRMDRDRLPDQPTAADVLARIDELDLARILRIYGEEKAAKKIARAIIDVRYSLKTLRTTRELARVVASCYPEDYRMDSQSRPAHNATKTFQAIRIFVNNELNEINYGLQIAEKYLKLNGKLVTLTFHSLEDTIVKRHFEGNLIEGVVNPIPLRYLSPVVAGDKKLVENLRETSWLPIYKHVLTPTEEEIGYNPRARSAKLRAAVRIK